MCDSHIHSQGEKLVSESLMQSGSDFTTDQITSDPLKRP